MPFAELRVRLADRPGALEVLGGAVAAVGANIVSVDVQHVHDGHAIDVLSVRLPEHVALESLRVAVADVLGRADAGCRWAGRDALTVDVHIRRLRAKLGPEYEALIGTVRGVGYKLVPLTDRNAGADGPDVVA